MSRILVPTERPSVSSGLSLLEICLNYEPSDPLLLSTLLSCISALFVFLSMTTAESSAHLLSRVLNKIFAALVFSQPGQAKDSRSRVVKKVRMHAASLMVKIAQKYPLLLLPLFDQLYATVQGLSKDPEQLSKLERVTLQVCVSFNCATLFFHSFINFACVLLFLEVYMKVDLLHWSSLFVCIRVSKIVIVLLFVKGIAW